MRLALVGGADVAGQCNGEFSTRPSSARARPFRMTTDEVLPQSLAKQMIALNGLQGPFPIIFPLR